MFKELPGRPATVTTLTDKSTTLVKELTMRTALRSTERHAHLKAVLSVRRRTRRATAVAPLGVANGPRWLLGLRCEVGDLNIIGHPQGEARPGSGERSMRQRIQSGDAVSSRRWRSRLVVVLATMQRRWFSWPPRPTTRPRFLMVVLGRQQETLRYSKSGLPPRGAHRGVGAPENSLSNGRAGQENRSQASFPHEDRGSTAD